MKKYCSRCGLELPEEADTSCNCPRCGLTTVTTTPVSRQRKTGRPQSVTVISVLSIIGGLIATIFGLIVAVMFSRGVGLGGWIGTFAAYLSLIGVALFFGGLFSLFVGWGLWKGAEWAWTLTVVLEILVIVAGVLTIPYGLIAVFVCGLILYYLFKPNVKEWFKKPSEAIMDKAIIKEEKPDPRTLYKQLLDYYHELYSSGNMLDREIEHHIRKGLSREEAILEIAKKKGFIGVE